MHNTLQRPKGEWHDFVAVPRGVWLTGIDQNLFQSVNGDLGGEWDPATIIYIGGSGVQVSGAFEATNATSMSIAGELLVESAGDIEFVSGGLMFFEDATFCNFNSGSTTTFASGSHLNILDNMTATLNAASSLTTNAGAVLNLSSSVSCGGALTFTGTSWPLLGARSIQRAVPLNVDWGNVAITHAIPGASTNSLCAFMQAGGIVTHASADNNDSFRVRIHQQCLSDGNVLDSVTVSFLNAGAMSAPAIVNLVKVDVNGVETQITSGPLTASQNQGFSTLTIPSGATIDLVNYVYKIVVTCPLPAGTKMTVTGAYTSQRVSQKRI